MSCPKRRLNWMRVLAGFLYLTAILVFLTALLGLGLSLLSDPPAWNVAGKFLESFGWAYLGWVHSELALARERR